MRALILPLLGAVLGAAGPATPALAVSIDWVTVGLPGNAADEQTGFGSVAYTYRISKYEVTNAQYVEFLNAVATTDPNGLYNTEMASGLGGITRSGGSGSFQYEPISGREQMPVVFVSFYDALRFANWMHNGQLSGVQDATTTEGGTYTITPQGIADNSITRNAGANIFLPNWDEWYKAAYHDALGLQTTAYFDYPAGADAQTTCGGPTGTVNHANCNNQVLDLTNVGGYTGSPSPWGTFDQGGNIWEWNEAISISGKGREIRGGSFGDGPTALAVTTQLSDLPSNETATEGFRLASIPEPGTGLLVALGMVVLSRLRHCREQRRQGASGRFTETTE